MTIPQSTIIAVRLMLRAARRYEDIAACHGISTTSVATIAKNAGLQNPRGRPRTHDSRGKAKIIHPPGNAVARCPKCNSRVYMPSKPGVPCVACQVRRIKA